MVLQTSSFAYFRPYAGIADVLSVNVGLELLKIVPGHVSTEVDAHLSYDTQKTVDKVSIAGPRTCQRCEDLYTVCGCGRYVKRRYGRSAQRLKKYVHAGTPLSGPVWQEGN